MDQIEYLAQILIDGNNKATVETWPSGRITLTIGGGAFELSRESARNLASVVCKAADISWQAERKTDA